MQNTLLGVAIAIILALVAALVGPLLIDWGGHRSLFEVQASRLLGVPVRVGGGIDARLLPTPRLTLNDIEIGRPGPDSIHARALGLEFALGPLMRGEWRASDLQLSGPRLTLGLDASGHVMAPSIAVGFDADGLTVDRLSIDDGAVTFADAVSGASVTLDKFWFNGDARSLLGPFKGEGAVTVGGELYPFRIATGRYGDDAGVRVHLNVDPVSRPLSIEADGALMLAGGDPKFEGTFGLARPVGIASPGAAAVTQPWRIGGKVKANATAALLQQVEFQYGSEEQGLKLTGVADFKFGRQPRFDGVLSGRQIDLDRALASGDGSRPLPAAALRQLVEAGGGIFQPSIPIQIGVGIDQLTLGAGTVQNVRGDISTDTGGWNLDRFEFRAPGFTQVRLSGHLAVDATGVAFTGPAQVDANDPKALTAWLEGKGETAQQDLRPMKLRGDVTLASDRLAVERLQAEFDRKTITGRFAYLFAGAQPAKLDATLNAQDLDIDAALGFGSALLAGSSVERPHDMTIAADIGRASFGSLIARNASARLKVDAQGLQIDKLTIADVGGGSFSANGRIETGGRAPHGSLVLDFESRQTAAIAGLAEKYAPAAAKPVSDALGRLAHAKLHATLDVIEEQQPVMTTAQLTLSGAADAMNMNVSARVSGAWDNPASADVHIDGTIDAPEGAALVKLLGLDRYATVGKGPGQLKLLVSGPADRDQQMDVKLTAEGLSLTSLGRGSLSLDKGLQLNSNIDVAKVDLRPLLPSGMAGEPLLLSLNSRVAIAGKAVTFDDVTARLGRSTVRGALAFDGEQPRRVSGNLEADTGDAAALIAAAIGMPSSVADKNRAWTWSSEPFAAGIFGDYAGQIPLKVGRLDLSPRLTAREFRATLRLGKNGFIVDDANGDVAGGRLTGKVSFESVAGGLKADAKFALANVDAAAVLPTAARPPVSGSLSLTADATGAGLSPVALIGSLQGTGKVTLVDGQFSGLDPRAFDAVTRAVDMGLPIDGQRIGGVVQKTLDGGQLSIKRAEGTLSISAGQLRLSNVTVESKDADLTLAGSLDLTEGAIDARMVLSGTGRAAGARPDIFMALQGSAAAPSRTIDVSALAGWLTLRAVENQTRQLRDIESSTPKPATQPPAPKSELAPALPPPIDIRPSPAR